MYRVSQDLGRDAPGPAPGQPARRQRSDRHPSGVRELAYRLLQLVDLVDDLLGDAGNLFLHLLAGDRRIQKAEDRSGDEAAGEGEEVLPERALFLEHGVGSFPTGSWGLGGGAASPA